MERAVLDLERDRPPLLVLDLTGLSFIDSTGLSVLLTAAERARRQHRRLMVVRPPLPARRVFTLARVDGGMECIDDPVCDATGESDPDATSATVVKLTRTLEDPKPAQLS